MDLVTVEVEVPKGYENIIQATAAAVREKEQTKTAQEGSMAQAILKRVVEKRLYGLPYTKEEPNLQAVGQLCRDVGSRARNVFVELEGVEWPVKALYFIVYNAMAVGLGKVPYNHPTNFQTLEAVYFFEGLGYEVIRKS